MVRMFWGARGEGGRRHAPICECCWRGQQRTVSSRARLGAFSLRAEIAASCALRGTRAGIAGSLSSSAARHARTHLPVALSQNLLRHLRVVGGLDIEAAKLASGRDVAVTRHRKAIHAC